MAHTCGAHQGAEVMLTCFEASRGLQLANKKRGKTRMRMRGEASNGGGARIKVSWWRCYHMRQSRLMRGQSVLEGSHCGSQDRILSSMLGPPLHYSRVS